MVEIACVTAVDNAVVVCWRFEEATSVYMFAAASVLATLALILERKLLSGTFTALSA